jgi:hypothetical protein
LVLRGHRGLVERSERLGLEVLLERQVQPVQRAHKALQGLLVLKVQPEKLGQRVQPVHKGQPEQILQFRVHRGKPGRKVQRVHRVYLGAMLHLSKQSQLKLQITHCKQQTNFHLSELKTQT